MGGTGAYLRREDIVAVIAAHRPGEDLAQQMTRLAEQVGRTIVIDDGSGPDWDRFYERLRTDRAEDLTVVRSEQNRGIAHALNLGVQMALQGGCSVVVTLDQDSTLLDDYIKSMIRAAMRLRSAHRPFAALAAGKQSGSIVRSIGYADRGDALTPTREAIQSGLFIPVATFARTGVFDEALFIDCVDTDFIARAATIGLPTYLNRTAAIHHSLGRQLQTSGLRVTRQGTRSFPFHPPWRRYYIARNRTLMFGRYGLRAPLQATVGTAGEVVQFARCLIFGPDKVRQVVAVAIGVADAIRGRRGRLCGRSAALLSAP